MADRTVVLSQNGRHAVRGLSVNNPSEFSAYQDDDDDLTYVVDLSAYLDGDTITVVTRVPQGVFISNSSNTTTRLTQRLRGFGYVDFKVQTSAGDVEEFRINILRRTGSKVVLGASGGGGTGVTPGDYGDISISAGNVWTIDPLAVTTAKIAHQAVTFGKFQHIAQNEVVGRVAAGTGDTKALSANEVIDVVNAASNTVDSTRVSFTQAGTGASTRTVDAKLKDTVSVTDFGTNATALQNAAAASKAVVVPKGTYTLGGTADIGTSIFETSFDSTITGTIAPSGLTYSGPSIRYGIKWANTSVTAQDIYTSIFPGQTAYDITQTVIEAPNTHTLGHVCAVSAYAVNRQAVAGIDRNTVLFFGCGKTTVNSAAIWGVNTLLQDADTRTAGTDTGRILLGAELDFNVMNPATQVIGASLGGNSLSQPTNANGYVVNSLGTGIKWVTGFLSLDGCATNAFSAGAVEATGASRNSQNVLFQYRDSGNNGRNIALNASSDGRIDFSGSAGGTFNGIRVNTPNGGDAVVLGSTAATGATVNSGRLRFVWRDSGSTERDLQLNATGGGYLSMTGTGAWQGIALADGVADGIVIGKAATAGNNIDSAKLRFNWRDNANERSVTCQVDEFSGTGFFTVSSTGTWQFKVSFADIGLDTGQGIRIGGNVVLSSRQTGWTAATGTATRTSFDTATVTTAQLAERVKALIDNLITHGLIGA